MTIPSAPSALFRTDAQREVLRELVRSPSGTRTAADLARTLGRPESTVTREVARLAADGMVRAVAHGRRRLLSPDYTNPFMRAVRTAFEELDTIAAERGRGVRWWSTTPELAARTGELVRAGEDDRALRVLLDGVNQIPLVAALDGLGDMLGAPAGTGDERWDALLAGSVRYRTRLVGRAAPAWTRRDPLPTWWWPGGRGARAAFAMQHTPPELARLGIWFDARNFGTA